MRPATTTTRLLAFFVVAFLCLNAGAFLCLAYCGKAMAAAAENCPLKKAGVSHCPHSQTANRKNDESFAGSSVTCCVLPIGVFGVPLDSKAGVITSAPIAVAVKKIDLVPAVLAASRQIPKFY